MNIRSITGVAGVALGLALTAGVALAQTGPTIGGPTSPSTQRQLMNSPGYSIGTGSAEIGGPTSPATQRQLQNTPGYTIGTGSSPSWPAYCFTTSRAELRQHPECHGAPHE